VDRERAANSPLAITSEAMAEIGLRVSNLQTRYGLSFAGVQGCSDDHLWSRGLDEQIGRSRIERLASRHEASDTIILF